MNIFDAHISGSLSVSGSGEISNDLLISGNLTVLGWISGSISGSITNATDAETASHAPKYTLTSSFNTFTSSYNTGSFSGSFKGDGSNLYNIPASGVTGLNLNKIISGSVSASISPNRGFEVNTDATFTGSVNITGSIYLNGNPIGTGKLDETTFNSYTSSINTYTGNTESTIATLSTTSSVNTLSGSIATTNLNQNNRLDLIETSTSSLNGFTSSINTTIKSKLDADSVVSGSVQVNITGTTGYSTFSSSISSSIGGLSSSISSSIGSLSSSVATTTSGLSSSIYSSIGSLSSSVATTTSGLGSRINSLEGVSGSYATTGSNLFKGTQTHSGSILPSVDNQYDLGSAEYQWRDVYISSGSLYIDGTKVISSTAQELVITTDNGQSIKILESTTDSIILQTADGDIELKSSADGDILLDPTNGKIMLKGPVEILSGQKIQSSVGGTPVVFANDIVVSGSIDITGTIEGINLTDFSSSVNTRLGSLESTVGNLNSYTSSNTTNVNAIHTSTSSLNSFTSSINTTIKSKLDSDGVISGSIQIMLTGTTGYSTFSSSVSSSVGSLSGSIATTTSGLSSSIDSLSSSVATTTSGISSTVTSLSSSVSSSIGSLSSSIATTTSGISGTVNSLSSSVATTTSGLSSSIGSLSSSVATTTSNVEGRSTSLESKTGSYATTGSNIFKGNQTISGSVIITENLTVFGSSSITYVTSSQLRIEDNIITVNTASPGQRFGGLEVHDSGSVGIATGSILWDSVNNRWIYQNSSEASYGGGVLLSGPRSSGSLGSELTLTSGRIAKSAGGDHLNDSNISDDGTTVTILSNTIINGTISSTGTTIVSGSSQISHDSTTGYVANKHIDHTSVSITAGNGLSGGGDISTTRTISLDTASSTFTSGVKSKMNTDGVISGSSQILNGSGVWSGSAQLPSGVVSGSSQVLSGTGIWSGSAQLPSGVVSGSSQVLVGTTIHSGAFFNGISVVSGSSQISFNGITDKPTLVSGSSQITYGSLSGIPTGIVSGSSQITFGSIGGLPTLVSGSSQIDLTATTNYSTGIKTRLNAEGVISGSSQITLTSGQVTTGLGYTPYNSTNPSGYITGISFASVSSKPTTLSGYGITDSIKSNGTINNNIDSDWGESFTTFDPIPSGTPPLSSPNIRTVNIGADYNRRTQMAFNYATDQAWFRRKQDSTWNTWREFIHSGNIGSQTVATAGALSSMNISQFTNNSGYITGINSSAVTTALGYTPYNATNPNGYISSITSGNVTTALGYTPYNATNPNGYITGISFANVSSKPTTISGYGITDAITTGNISSQSVSYASTAGSATQIGGRAFSNTGDNSGVAADSLATNGISYVSSNIALLGQTDGALYSQAYSTAWQHQIYGDYRTGQIVVRGKNSGTWQAWRTIIDSTTIGSQSVSYASTAGSATSASYATTAGSAPNGSNVNNYYSTTAGNGYGFRFWGGSDAYKISMGNSSLYQYGTVTDYSIKMQMNDSDSGRGFTWGRESYAPIASLNATSGNMQIAGSFTLGGILTENSSIRYKKDVETIKYGLDKVLQMRGVTYIKKDTGLTEVGVIAEEMNEVEPLLIIKNEEGEVDSVTYSRINAYLIEAVKELKQEINEQNLIITELKRKLGL